MEMRKTVLWLLGTTTSVALGASPAAAQNVQASQNSTDVQQTAPADPSQSPNDSRDRSAIVITGVRGSVISSINRKKNLSVIADVISAEDIGKFPDRNLAESLQRITGVQITREAGEGKFVSVRGLPPEFNLITLDGHYLADASIDQLTQQSDRRFDFSILPSDFIQALEVYKSPQADLDEGGVSSTINVKTLHPLELSRPVISLSADGQYEGNSKKWAPKITGVLSQKFLDGKLGVALAAVYDRRKYTELSTTAGQLDPITFTSGQLNAGVPLTAGHQYLMVDSIGRTKTDETRVRKTLDATIQYEPVDHLRFTLQGLYADFKSDSQSANFTSRPYFGVLYSGAPVTQATVDSSDVITSLQTTDSAIELQGFREIERRKIKSGSGDITFDDGVTMARFSAAYSEANASSNGLGLDNFLWGPLTHSAAPGGYVMNPNDPVVQIVLPGGIPSVNQFGNNYIGDNVLTRTDRSFEIQGDLARELNFGFLNKLKVGFKVGSRKRTNSSEFLQDLSVRFSGPPAVQDLSRFVSGSVDASMDAYSGSNLNFAVFPQFQPDLYLSSCCGGSLTDWQQRVFAGQASGTGPLSVRINQSLEYGVKEDTKAAYAMLDFGTEEKTVTGNIGVRVINTHQTVDTFGVDLANIQPSTSSLIPPVIPSSGPLSLSRSYTDVLPSLNVTWGLADRKLLIRGAIAKVMSRPILDFLVPRYSVDTSRTPFYISGGNPDLKPYHAWQYDLSFEYYPKQATIFSLALFQKNIDSFIYTGTRSFTAGQYSFLQSLPINGSPANLRGVEFNATTFFDFLPSPLNGFGAQVNATYAEGKIKADPANGLQERPFEGLSKWTYNLVVFYEKGGLNARVAYNFRSKYESVADLRAQGIESMQNDAFRTLDGQISYDFTKNVSVYLEGINLLNEPNITYVKLFSTGATYPLDFIQSGRRVIVGARLKF